MSGEKWLDQVTSRLRNAFTWRGDHTDGIAMPTSRAGGADPIWDLGPALAGLFADDQPTVIRFGRTY